MRYALLLLSLLITTGSLFAQAPLQFSFQAVVRDANDELLADTPVGMQISILQGSSNGTAVYVETHSTSTNANGLVSLQVGGGTVQSGSLATIDWGNGPYFIKSETDPNGGTNYTIAGTQQMMSVPYALFAANAGSGDPTPSTPVGFRAFDGDYAELNGGSNQLSFGTELYDHGNGFSTNVYVVPEDGIYHFTTMAEVEPTGSGEVSLDIIYNNGIIGGRVSRFMSVEEVLETSADLELNAGDEVRVFVQFENLGGGNSFLRSFTAHKVAGVIGGGGSGGGGQWTANGDDIHNTAGGQVGIGTSTPQAKLHVQDGAVRISNTADNKNWEMAYDANGDYFYVDEYGNARHLVIQNGGQVGIGTDQPTSKLDINGEVRIRGGSPGAGKVLTSAADGLASWVSPPLYTWVSQSEYISCSSPPCAIDHTIMATCPAGSTRVQIIDLEVTAQGWDPDNNEMKVILPPDDRQSIGANVEFTITQVNLNKLIRVRALCVGGIPLPPY